MLVQFVFCTKMGKNEIEFKKQTSDIISIHDIFTATKIFVHLESNICQCKRDNSYGPIAIIKSQINSLKCQVIS